MNQIPSVLPSLSLQQDLTARAQTLQKQLAVANKGDGEKTQEMAEGVTQLESLFIFQLLQSMRKTVPQSDLLGKGFAHDLYTSLFDQEIAQQIARRGGVGLTPFLLRQFGEKAVEQDTVERGALRHANVPSPTPPTSGPVFRDQNDVLEMYRQQMEQTSFPFVLPVSGPISSPFGWRKHPITHTDKFHQGIDIAVPEGVLVRAAAPGRVIFSGEKGGYGNLVIIEHQDGYKTYYGHNSENLVLVGEYVERAQPIAKVGQTGQATGPHLHFEIRKDDQAFDPTTLLYTKKVG